MYKILAQISLILIYLLNYTCPASEFEQLSYEELDSIFESLFEQGKYQEGGKYAAAGRVKAMEAVKKKDSTYAKFTNKLARAYREMGSYQQAEQLFLEALSLSIKIFGKEHPGYVAILNNLAILYYNMGQYENAEHFYMEILNIGAKAFGDHYPDSAYILNNLALLYIKMGKYHRADPLCQEALKIYATLSDKNPQLYVTILNNLALLNDKMGRYDEAEHFQLKTLEIYAKAYGKKNPIYAKLLNNLAVIYKKVGIYEQAKHFYLEALNIRIKTLGKDHPEYAISLNNLAVLYEEMGRFEEAEPLYVEALKIYAKVYSKNHPFYGKSLSNLAVLYTMMEHYEKAKQLHFEALNIKTKTLGKNHPEYAISLNSIALLYEQIERYEDAEQFYLKALKIREKALGKKHPLCAQFLNNLAVVAKIRGHDQQAWAYAHQAICAISQLNLSTNIDRMINQLKHVPFLSNRHITEVESTLACMYHLLTKENNPESIQKRIQLADLMLSILKRSRDSYINDQDKLRNLAKSYDWMLKSLSILNLDEAFDPAFAQVEFHKSAILMEAAMSTRAYQLGYLPDSLMDTERQIKKQHGELQAQLLKTQSQKSKDSLQALLNEINLQIITFKKQVEQKFPKYAQLHYQSHQATSSEIQQNLSNNQALIEYVLGDSTLYILYIDQNQTFIKKRPIDQTIFSKIDNLRKLLSHFDLLDHQKEIMNDLYEQAHWFYNQLIAPLKSELQNKKHLIIVPDGELYHLPFEALMPTTPAKDSQNFHKPHYLLQDFEMSYHYSATLWVENQRKGQPVMHNGQLLALAASYKKDRQMNAGLRMPLSAKLRHELHYLPATQQEVASLAGSFNGYFGYDSVACERIFKEHASKYGVIHLAMHGMLNEKFPSLSSLVFTDTRDSIEDNFLQAYEISKMELRADLVVLSACQTGYGKFERGNGIASLARAFMYAGVPSLVVSLWQVDDIATANIMKDFYIQLARGENKSNALRLAKLNYLNNVSGTRAHPAYWSPFIQIGNSKPIKIQRKYAYAPWYVGLAVMCLIAGLVFWNRKRIF